MGNAGKMALSGASAGATAGSALGPWGTAIGAAIGGVLGYKSGKDSEKGLGDAQNKIDAAKKLMPAEVDPEVLAMKRGYDRMAKAYAGRAGSEYMRNNLASTTQNAINQAFRYSGGNFDVSQLKDVYHKGLFGINQQNEASQMAATQRASALGEAISQRQAQAQMIKYQQALAEGVSEKQAINANLMGALATTDLSGLAEAGKSIGGDFANLGKKFLNWLDVNKPENKAMLESISSTPNTLTPKTSSSLVGYLQ